MKSETKICQNCKNQFTIEPDDFTFYKKMKVPPPTWCPRCRMIRRLGVRGYRIFYKRKCDFTGQEVVSVHHPDTMNKIYRQDIWWSDKWDPRIYGNEYDFTRPFFTQFIELSKTVPLPALYTEHTTMVNSEYCNAAANLKNCYLCFNADNSENSAYLNTITNIKESLDLTFASACELCYDCLNTYRSYRIFYSEDCNECHDVYFSKDLVGCMNCFGCIGLRSKKYHFFNQALSREEYKKEVARFDLGSHRVQMEIRERLRPLFLKFPRKAFIGRRNTNSSGEYLDHCENVRDSYMVGSGKNIRYAQFIRKGPSSEAYDYTHFATNAEWIYESCWVGIQVNNVKFGFWGYKCHDLEYCFGCHGSEYLFGCIGVRNGRYCILNKQYTKEEYEMLVLRIKEQMMSVPYTDAQGRIYRYGEFFPPEFSPWAYNESNAAEWIAMTEAEARAFGFGWRKPDLRKYQEATMVIPDNITEVKNDILEATLKCRTCGKNYRPILFELEFYRKNKIPFPQKCSFCRDLGRIHRLNPMDIFDRTCEKCGRAIQTSYAPDRPEIVYCEKCYQSEVV